MIYSRICIKGDCYTPEEIKEIKLEFNKATHEYGIEFFDCENVIFFRKKKKLWTYFLLNHFLS